MRIYTTTRIPPDEDAPDGSETVDAGNPTDDYVEKAPLTSPELGRRAASNASDDGSRRLTALSQLTADLLSAHKRRRVRPG